MSNEKNLTAETVIARTKGEGPAKTFRERYEPGDRSKQDRDARMELVTNSKHDIPMLHFVWHNIHFVMTYDKAEAEKLTALGYEVKESKGSDGKLSYITYVREVDASHLWFCNFRRYSWCWSPDPEAQDGSGFGRGPVYANGHILGKLVETPGDVVLLTALQAWEHFTRDYLPGFFLTAELQDAFADLVKDGIAHASRHANPLHRTEPFSFGKRVPLEKRHIGQPAIGDELAV